MWLFNINVAGTMISSSNNRYFFQFYRLEMSKKLSHVGVSPTYKLHVNI